MHQHHDRLGLPLGLSQWRPNIAERGEPRGQEQPIATDEYEYRCAEYEYEYEQEMEQHHDWIGLPLGSSQWGQQLRATRYSTLPCPFLLRWGDAPTCSMGR